MQQLKNNSTVLPLSIEQVDLGTEGPLFSNNQAASYLGLKPHTLDCWWLAKKHVDILPRVYIGKRAFYKKRDVDAFIRSCTVVTE